MLIDVNIGELQWRHRQATWRHMAPARAAPLQSGMVFIKHAAPSLLMQWLQQGRFPIYRGYKPAEKNNREAPMNFNKINRTLLLL